MKSPLLHPFRFRGLLLPLVAFLATFAIFAPSIGYSLVNLDDHLYLVSNPMFAAPSLPAAIHAAFSSFYAATFAPLLWCSYSLDVFLFRASPAAPWGFHLTNILLHAANAALFALLLSRFCKNRLAAFFCALLWAIHPLRVESVAWLAGRKDDLSLFFALLSVWAWLRFLRPSVSRSARAAAALLSLTLFAASLLVKSAAVSLPAVLLLLDVWPLGRIPLPLSRATLRSAALRIAEKLPFFALAAASSLLSAAAHADLGVLRDAPLPLRLASVPLHATFYLLKTALPFHLSPLYPDLPCDMPRLLASLFLLAALGGAALLLRRRAPALLLGLLVFGAFLLPVSGIVRFGVQSIADRFTYLPALGLSIAILPLFSLREHSSRHITVLAAASALLALLPVTFLNLRTWASPDALYARVALHSPGHPYAVAYRARTLIAEHGDFGAAEALLDPALAKHPDFESLRVLKAVCLDERLGPAAALDFYSTVPAASCTEFDFREAAQYALRAGQTADIPPILNMILSSLPASDSLVQDIRYLRLAVAWTDHDEPAIRQAAADIPQLANRPAITPLDLLPHYLNQWKHLHRRDAWTFFKACADDPAASPADLNNLAWLLATAPGWNPALPEDILAIARRAAAALPDHPVILDTLAAALANASDFPAAIETAQQALALLPSDSPLASRIQSHLSDYLQSSPFRSTP